MDVHRHGIKLFEGGNALEQDDNGSTPLHRLYGPGQQVGGEGLEILQHTHAVGITLISNKRLQGSKESR